jgi:hypothetical protein
MPDATLRDVTVEPNPPSAAATAEPVVAPALAATAAQSVEDKEALELGRVLRDSGVTQSTVNELLAAPQALQTMRYLVQNNPQEFLNLIERTDPSTGEKFLENMADTYVRRYAPKDGAVPAGGKKGEASAEIMSEVAALREEIGQLRTNEQRKQEQIALSQIQARYDGRVEELFNALPKDANLTKAESKALKAQLSMELGQDAQATQRISNGNFVDVPRKFQTILDGWSSDRKGQAEAAKAQREGRLNAANPEFLGGPQQFQIDPKDADSWDATEAGFAKALDQAR